MYVFTIYTDQLEKRIDPQPYLPQRLNAVSLVKKSTHNKFKLSEVVDFRRELVSDNPNNLLYIGLENITSNTGEYIPSSEEKTEFGSAFRVYAGDIIFPKLRPYLNKVYVAQFDAICSTEFHVLIPKKSTAEYLFAFLSSKVIVDQTSCLMTGNTLPRLQTDDIENLLVPIPDENIQNEITKTIKSLFPKKKLLQEKANACLTDIDKYILDKLSVAIDISNNSITYTVFSDEIKGRIDSPYYHPTYTTLAKQLDEKEDAIQFDDIIEDLSGGATPTVAGDYYADENDGIPFLRVQNVTENGIILEDVKYIKSEVHDGLLRRSKLQKDDLVFTITGRIGSVAVCPDNFVGNINQHSVRIKLKSAFNEVPVNPHYVATYFNSAVGRKISIREITGGTRPALDYKALRSLWLVLPSEELQNEIVEEVNKRKQEARALLDEVDASVSEARTKIEEMIFGL